MIFFMITLFPPTETLTPSSILRLYILLPKKRPIVPDCIMAPLKKTLPSLESNSQFFTACYCHISQCLILSNWVITTTLLSDTPTARSVQSVASFPQRDWVYPPCTTEYTAREIPKSNKSVSKKKTHMFWKTSTDGRLSTSHLLQVPCRDFMMHSCAKH